MFKLLLLFNAYYVLFMLLLRMQRSDAGAGVAMAVVAWMLLYLWAPFALLLATLATVISMVVAKRSVKTAGAPALTVNAHSLCGYDVTGYVVPVQVRKAHHRNASFILPANWNATPC